MISINTLPGWGSLEALARTASVGLTFTFLYKYDDPLE